MRKVSPVLLIAVVIVSAVLLDLSCSDSTNPVSKIEDVVFPAKNISYYRTIQPLFDIACATSGCHNSETQADGLDLTSFSLARYSKPLVIIPKDTTQSRLIWSIEGKPGSYPMPPSRSLTLNQITGFKQWILEGATDTIP